MLTGYVPGGFDMLHIGHLNILTAAAARCERLVVGVATDESLERMKGHRPIVCGRGRCGGKPMWGTW